MMTNVSVNVYADTTLKDTSLEVKEEPPLKRPRKGMGRGSSSTASRASSNIKYIGSTTDLPRRIKQHNKIPPAKMEEDLQRYKPFKENFEIKVLETTDTVDKARTLEQYYIRSHNTVGPLGYNTLEDHSVRARKYYFLKRRNIIDTKNEHVCLEKKGTNEVANGTLQ